MAMLACPHCGGPGISTSRKLWLGPAIPAKCRTCGKKIGVPWSRSLLAFLPFGIALLATANIQAWSLRILILAAGSYTMFLINLRYVPLVPR
jgi:hypothetical protein